MEHKINGSTVTVDLRPKQLSKEDLEAMKQAKVKTVKEGKKVSK